MNLTKVFAIAALTLIGFSAKADGCFDFTPIRTPDFKNPSELAVLCLSHDRTTGTPFLVISRKVAASEPVERLENIPLTLVSTSTEWIPPVPSAACNKDPLSRACDRDGGVPGGYLERSKYSFSPADSRRGLKPNTVTFEYFELPFNPHGTLAIGRNVFSIR